MPDRRLPSELPHPELALRKTWPWGQITRLQAGIVIWTFLLDEFLKNSGRRVWDGITVCVGFLIISALCSGLYALFLRARSDCVPMKVESLNDFNNKLWGAIVIMFVIWAASPPPREKKNPQKQPDAITVDVHK